MGNLSKHLSSSEVTCKCGCGYDSINLGLTVIFELMRHFDGDKPARPNSVCRCVHHNELIQMDVNENYTPFSSQSKHLPDENKETIAMDYPSENPAQLYTHLDILFPNTFGIGVYSWGVHIDLRQQKARWSKL